MGMHPKTVKEWLFSAESYEDRLREQRRRAGRGICYRDGLTYGGHPSSWCDDDLAKVTAEMYGKTACLLVQDSYVCPACGETFFLLNGWRNHAGECAIRRAEEVALVLRQSTPLNL